MALAQNVAVLVAVAGLLGLTNLVPYLLPAYVSRRPAPPPT